MPAVLRLLALPLATLLLLTLASPAQAIVGGSETGRDWPHMVAMEYRDGSDHDFRCGGSLVRPDVVLTAAHCVDGDESNGEPDTLPADRFRFQAGTRTRSQGGERLQAVQIVEHPDWDDGKDGHDVALVKLERSSTLGAPIRIAGDGEAGLFAPGDEATIIGWGSTFAGGGAVDDLREARVPIQSDESCRQNYTVTASFDAPTMLCAGNLQGGEDTCQGDSGGPLMVPGSDGRFVLVADTSFGVGCAFPTQYGVYGEVAGAALRGWTESKASELSTSSGPPAMGTGTPAAPPAGGGAPSSEPARVIARRIRLTLPRSLGSARRARARRRLVVLLRTNAPLRTLRATLRQRGRTVATGRRTRLSGRSGRLTMRVRGRLRAGRATLRLTARDSSGGIVRSTRVVRLRR